ncbi:MAG: hypothetical protein ACYTEQ_30630 [Planctomycetota bacterium]|jgi:hypothetical protein
MGLESATYLDGLVITKPTGGDDRSTSDDHHRLIKTVLKNSFPNIAGAMNASHTELNFLVGQDQAVGTNDSPTFAGLTCAGTINLAGATVSDLGAVTTADINGGTIDGVVIGGAAALAGTFTVLTATGAFTSLGIDDNATGERLQLSDTAVTWGTAGSAYFDTHVANDQLRVISGGDATTSGSNIVLYGGTTATTAGDLVLRTGSTAVIT